MARLRVLDEAAAEAAAAAEHLESERPAYGRLFLEEYARILQQLVQFPRSGAPMGVFDDVPLRSFVVSRFRYSVLVGELDDESIIVAVAHASREPGYWRGRLR
jgi:plasmid stabilization system protein ParE